MIVYHDNGGEDEILQRHTNKRLVQTDSLSGLELAKYVLGRLTNDQSTIGKMAEDFDNNKKFISGVGDFLQDIVWMIQDRNGLYQVTRRGQANTIIRVGPRVDFSVRHNRG